jgi:electron transport complex protein RnfG
MKKLESSLKNMAIVLTGVTVIAGGLLGYVNELTKEPIAEANAKALSDAIQLVVPGFDNNPAAEPEEVEVDGQSYTVYKATKGGEFIGAAVKSTDKNGFGGALTILVGFNPQGEIIDYSVLSHSETPGLGSKSTEWFKKGAKGDITGMNPGQQPLTVSKDGGNVDAITASTITSRAFLRAVNAAYAAYAGQEHTDGNSGASQQAKQAVEEAADSVAAAVEEIIE